MMGLRHRTEERGSRGKITNRIELSIPVLNPEKGSRKNTHCTRGGRVYRGGVILAFDLCEKAECCKKQRAIKSHLAGDRVNDPAVWSKITSYTRTLLSKRSTAKHDIGIFGRGVDVQYMYSPTVQY